MEAATASPVVERIAPSGLMTTEQAAAYLAVKPATLQVWRSTNRKKLAYVKVGGNVRYRRQDLDQFIADNLQNAR
ncbi:MAG: helix-turn-helix domain-containing protein [Paucibacter sp.]|nr:helix-turn-helix domain-containing protein [Roseateles sp.]